MTFSNYILCIFLTHGVTGRDWLQPLYLALVRCLSERTTHRRHRPSSPSRGDGAHTANDLLVAALCAICDNDLDDRRPVHRKTRAEAQARPHPHRSDNPYPTMRKYLPFSMD